MKRIICFISLVLAMSMLLSVPVFAEESGTFSSLYFTSYDSFIYIPSGRTIEIWFDVVGKGEMEEIGVSAIRLERSLDGVTWIEEATFSPEDYPQMICENTGITYDCVTYTGEYRYYYRAYVTFYGKKDGGRGYAYQYSEVEYIPR